MPQKEKGEIRRPRELVKRKEKKFRFLQSDPLLKRLADELSPQPWKLPMNILRLLIVSLSLAAASLSAAEAELVVLKFHADWCGSCKTMGPVLEDLQNKFDGKAVLFLEFDRTNRSTEHQAMLLADVMDISPLYSEQKGTGYLLLVDAESGKVLDRFTKADTLKEMSKRIQAKLDEA